MEEVGLDVKSYQEIMQALERAESIAAIRQGLKEMGKGTPAREVLEEMRKQYKIPAERYGTQQEISRLYWQFSLRTLLDQAIHIFFPLGLMYFMRLALVISGKFSPQLPLQRESPRTVAVGS